VIRIVAGMFALSIRAVLLPFHIVLSSLLQSADALLREAILDWQRVTRRMESDDDPPDAPG